MADLGAIEAEIRTFPQELRPSLLRIFRTFLRDIRFGHPAGSAPDPLQNIGGAFLYGTTPAIASTEFSISHGFGRTPYLAWPVLPLDAVGAKIVPLTVTRVADDKRIYLSSTVVSAPITLVCEG